MSIMIRDDNTADIENTDYSTYTNEQLLHKLEYYNNILNSGFVGMFYGCIVEDKSRIEEELEKRKEIEIMDLGDDTE
jgi:hypothetical protein